MTEQDDLWTCFILFTGGLGMAVGLICLFIR